MADTRNPMDGREQAAQAQVAPPRQGCAETRQSIGSGTHEDRGADGFDPPQANEAIAGARCDRTDGLTDETLESLAAFPRDCASFEHKQTGMSLRDWFAGQIAGGIAAHSGTTGASFGPGDIAVRSYEIADAMLAARAKGE